MSKTGAGLSVILSGQIGAFEPLFEGSGSGVTTDFAIRLYADDPVSRSCNLYASEAAQSHGISTTIESVWPFEIGAGTGGTAPHLLLELRWYVTCFH